MTPKVRTFFTVVLFVGSIVAIVATLVLVVKEKKRAHLIEDEIKVLEEEKKYFEKSNADLRDRITYLKSEHSYEKEAKRLNYKKPGEHVVIVRRSHIEQEQPESPQDTVETPKEIKKHYEIWLQYFF